MIRNSKDYLGTKFLDKEIEKQIEFQEKRFKHTIMRSVEGKDPEVAVAIHFGSVQARICIYIFIELWGQICLS